MMVFRGLSWLHREVCRLHDQRALDAEKTAKKRAVLDDHPALPVQDGLDIVFGCARGTLRRRGDAHAYCGGDMVGQTFLDASRGTMFTGAMGSGKTSLQRSIARQVAKRPEVAVLALSAKPDDTTKLLEIFTNAQRSGLFIAPGADHVSLLAGLAPARAGAALGALCADPVHPFWRVSVENLAAAWLQIACGLAGKTIAFPEQREELDRDGNVRVPYAPERTLTISYSAQTLSDLLYADAHVVRKVLSLAGGAIAELQRTDPDRAAQLDAGVRYFTGEFQATLGGDPRVLADVRSSLSPYLRALTQPGIAETLGEGDVDIPTALDAGGVVILGIDAAENPRAFAVASALLIAHLHVAALQRTARDPATNNPVICLFDEYGSYADDDHVALFETCRQAQICPYVSVISLTNLAARVGEKAARSLPGAFGSLVCFATGDDATRRYLSGLIGRARVRETTTATRERHDANIHHQALGTTHQTDLSTREIDHALIHDELWAHLGVMPATEEEPAHARAIAVITQGGRQYRDVIMVPEGA